MLYLFGSCIFLCVLFFFVSQLFQKLKGVEEKPVSDGNNAPQIKYDVFVSFRGEDIRRGLLSHLIEAFKSNHISVFVDHNLDKGEEIWPSLVEAIEGSSILLIIFSPDYASSRWCLEEVVKIFECREKYRRTVIPIFYYVEPTDVRHQSGSYKNAFDEHERKQKGQVQLWRHALNMSANLSGIESSKFQDDAGLIKEIVNFVNLVLKRLAKAPVNLKRLVGIDEKIAMVESWIREEPKDTCLIGIWGMGGLGKTTLAEKLFNKLRFEYEGSYFLANERDQSSKYEITFLKKEIFSKLLGCDVEIDTPNSLPENIVKRTCCMKVFIVLDDVNDSNHIEKLLGILDNFGSGSKIIVTTRDEQVLKSNKVDKIYHLTELSSYEALDLFNLNAFNRNDHQREYNELSKRLVAYAHGIPLLVNVLARLICGKNKEEWESLLDKLKKGPPKEVYDVMKLSYDGLDHKGQQIFLDLACFFLRRLEPVNISDLKSLLKDHESDNSVAFELGRLKDKALITFSEDNIVSMHDTLQEMAWQIVRQESIEDLGKRSRLWDPDDIYEALKNDKVTEAIRSIQIQLPKIKEHKLIPHIFSKMSKLQFLEILGKYNYDCFDQLHILAKGLQFLATELRFLCWIHCPLKFMPDNLSFEKLVILKMQYGRMDKLWDGVKNLVNLKEIDLSQSQMLKELPDLSKATNLETLVLRYCSMLTSVHPSIFSLGKLEKLDLGWCTSLTILVSISQLCSLKYLNLEHCENLTEFSVISKNMKELRLKWTKVKTLPSSFEHQSNLELLDLSQSDIERLPSTIDNHTQLLHLDISHCSKLQTIPKLPLFLETLNVAGCTSLHTLPKLCPSLKTLDFAFCKSLETLPELPLSLETLNTKSCLSLQTIPKLPLSLKTLKATMCKSLQTLPELPPSLETLIVKQCTSLQTLQELPPSLTNLDVRDCHSLKTVLFPSTAVEQLKENRKRIVLWDCLKLDEDSLMAIAWNAQINVMKFANQHISTPNHHYVHSDHDYDRDDDNYCSYQALYVYPGRIVPDWLEYKTRKDYIIIDLSSTPSCSHLGFIFCFVLRKYEFRQVINRFEFVITISDGDGDGEGKKDSVIMYINDLDQSSIESDHVCVMYDQRCSKFFNRRAQNQTRFKIQVTVGAALSYKELPQQTLKGFGVSPINTSVYNSFIQQMDFLDSMF